ncbi:mitogen-activated protein kinase kinase kinase 5 [Abeliophyllum distichum]|uniref:mitogen-activated protein kinase kinase kinase n=1 Tax=Abeliophyllum distichum TaxID=126358 RepID=A0ABD1V3I7_9LAMI
MSSDIYKINFPISAPTSPYSSPHLSPLTSNGDFLETHYTTPPSAFQVWSAPEMPLFDTHISTRSTYQMHPEKTTSNVDNSPRLHSPRASSYKLAASPNKPATPLHNKISPDTSLAWRESNAHATVHPLPLPPGAATPSQPTPSFPAAAKPEFHGTSMPSQTVSISLIAAIPESSGASMTSHPTLMSPLTPKPEFSATAMPSQPTPISLVTAKPELMLIKRQWQKGKLIGRGTFGSVYIASNRETGALCAMKEVEISPDDPKSAECVRQLEQEIKVLSRLKHQNIVQYYGSEIVGERFYIYLEYVHPGSINKFIHDHCGAITESVVRNFTRHILCGLVYLHSTKTIHRDIKGANLLVDANGVVKLADFGMAKHLTGYAANLSLKGSPYWMAPELLQSVMHIDASSDLALAVDIWSLGCTIIEMLNGKPPWSEYEGAAALFKVLKDTPPIPETLSADGKDFLCRCFLRNPADRPTARILLEHPFVK